MRLAGSLAGTAVFGIAVCVVAQTVPGLAPGDRDLFERIRGEGTERSQVEAIFTKLAVEIGPRLTASPAHKKSAEWARDQLTAFGLSNARLEPFSFGRGWSSELVTIEMVEPRYLPLLGYADGWSASTEGEITASPVWLGDKTPEEVAALSTSLSGAIVMPEPVMTNFIRADRPQPSEASYVANSAAYATSVGRSKSGNTGPSRAQRITETLRGAKAGVILRPSRGEHGTVFVTGRDQGPGAVPSITLSGEHYNLIAGLLQKQLPVKLRVNLQTKFFDSENGNTYNVLAELPGSDPQLKDEVVMIGAHLDSWHTGVGATDNADGVTTVMEAMRILKAVDPKPKRTIRVALWSGRNKGCWVRKRGSHSISPVRLTRPPRKR